MDDKMSTWDAVEEFREKTGYEGCANCHYQIEPLRQCEWAERGGDGTVHAICPRWVKRGTVIHIIEEYRPAEPLTYEEQGVFLAAMAKEKAAWINDQHRLWVCEEIERKVRAAVWI